MGIFSSIQCEHCGLTIKCSHTGKMTMISIARKKGWSVGKTIKCSECKKAKK